MSVFIVTARQAARMPRWLLITVCLLYAVPGLIGRDPWRYADAAGFGIAWTFAQSPWGQGWLIPGVAGQVSVDHGPLPFWLAALGMKLLPGLPADLTIRLITLAGLLLLMASVWYALWLLARRPRVQPADPFGASASATDFGRSVADSGLLLMLACIGLIARSHETTAETAQLIITGGFVFACAWALERPRLGGLLAGLMIGASLLTRGPAVAATLLAVLLFLPVLSRGWRLVWPAFHGWALVAAIAVSLPWPLALWASGEAGQAYLLGWLHASQRQAQSLGLDPLAMVSNALRTLPWFLWPAWPVALVALWQWRARADQPAIMLPALSLALLTVLNLVAPAANESGFLMLAPPCAMLAAFGLSTLRRGLGALIDWFAVMSFSLLGLGLWLYWIAMQTGWPPRMASSVLRAVPGYQASVHGLELLAALLTTIAWVALVAWRLARRPVAMWRPVTLSSGGLILSWVLLMTLWMPAANHRNTYRDVAQQAALALGTDAGCVTGAGLDLAQRTAFAYYGGLRFASDDASVCPWRLEAIRGAQHPSGRPEPAQAWELRWQGARAADRRERFSLLRRVDR
jgi:4-amino-4-deoxy-L-arabinose transferase-like glycosyltransferase